MRLCPRLHANPRYATVCSQCGSHELSKPQPKVPFWWKALLFVLQVLFGTLLMYLSLFLLLEALKTAIVQAGLVLCVLFLAALWALWIILPEWFRKVVTRIVQRKRGRDERQE